MRSIGIGEGPSFPRYFVTGPFFSRFAGEDTHLSFRGLTGTADTGSSGQACFG